MYTVKELIEILSKYPGELEVKVCCCNDDNYHLTPINKIKYLKLKNQLFIVIKTDSWE